MLLARRGLGGGGCVDRGTILRGQTGECFWGALMGQSSQAQGS